MLRWRLSGRCWPWTRALIGRSKMGWPRRRGILDNAAGRATRRKGQRRSWPSGLRSGLGSEKVPSIIDMVISVMFSTKFQACTVGIVLISAGLTGCRKEEQAVTKVAVSAAAAEHLARAASVQKDQQRVQ